MSLAFAVCIFHYAKIRYNCAAVYYGMHVGSLDFALVSALRLSILQLVVPIMLLPWRCARSFVLSRKRLSVHGSNRMNSASVPVTSRREWNINPRGGVKLVYIYLIFLHRNFTRTFNSCRES